MSDIETKLTELLGGRQLSTLTNALRVAADRFDEDARTFDEIAGTKGATGPGMLIFNPAAAGRLADQFRQQAADTRELLASIEGSDDDA